MKFFRRKKPDVAAAPVPVVRTSRDVPSCLTSLVRTVEESWEEPEAGQYDNAFESYRDCLLEPIEAASEALEEKRLLFRLKLQHMTEIAPDLFDKALRRHALETGYFIEGDET